MATIASRRWPFPLFLVFLAGYNLFRIVLFAMTLEGSVQTDRPLDPTALAMVVYSELGIGLVGLIGLPGLLRSREWGFWITAAVSAYAILFDGAAALLVQSSAAGGAIPPVVTLLALLVYRRRFHPVKAASTGASPAQV